MDQTQYSIHSLLKNKRNQLRETMRNNQLKKIFDEKRREAQQNQENVQESLIIQSTTQQKTQSIIDSESESDSNSEQKFLTRLTKIKSKMNLTPNYLKQIIQYLKKEPQIYQIVRIFTLCEDAITDKKFIGSDLVPYLVEIIFIISKYKNDVIFRPLYLLLQAYVIHQEYLILQYLKIYLSKNILELYQIDEFCKNQIVKMEDNLLYIICTKQTYANYQMLLFLCETIQNIEFIQALQYYGAKIFDKTIEHKKDYRKTIQQIQQLVDIRLSNKEVYYQK